MYKPRMRQLAVLFLIVWNLIEKSTGFSNDCLSSSQPTFTWKTSLQPSSTFRTQSPSSQLLASSSSSSDNDEDSDDQSNNNNDNDDDMERVRQQLESLLGPESSSSSLDLTAVDVDRLMDPAYANEIEDMIPPPPPLTSAERDRRLAEIEMLQALKDSDEPLQDLWELWFSERGKTAKERLEQVDQFMAGGQIVVAEKMLRQMIQEYGVYWVEPINRLATLLYLSGRLEESYKLCLVVLHLRPYHFGALSGIVAVSIGLGKREDARKWAEKRLPSRVASTSFPPFAQDGPTNPRRKEWVQRAVKQAQETLSHLEYQIQKDFGKPEKYYKQKKKWPSLMEEQPPPSQGLLDTNDDAWQ
eukprot:scaffold35500_cov168-Amphora_coffeaeformis.AAC.2